MLKRITLVTSIFLNLLFSANVMASPLKCSERLDGPFFGLLSAPDTSVPLVVDIAHAGGQPSPFGGFTDLDVYVPYGQSSVYDNTTTTCTENADGSLTEQMLSLPSNAVIYTAIMYPSEPNVWNITSSQLWYGPSGQPYNYTGKLRNWMPE